MLRLTQSPLNLTKKPPLLVFFLPAIVAAVFYYQTIHFGLVWDDYEWVQKNRDFNGNFLDWIIHCFTHNSIGSYYRPLAMLTFFYPPQSGNPATLWHLTSYALYIGNIILLGLILRNLYHASTAQQPGQANSWKVTVGSALALFAALHPTQVETVAWISGRFDLMSNMFMLLILWIDTSRLQDCHKTAFIPACFLLALLSKETAVIFLPALMLFHGIKAGLSSRPAHWVAIWKKHRVLYAMLTWTIMIYAVAYLMIAGHESIFSKTQFSPLYNDTASHIRLVLATLGYYLQLLCYPLVDLSPFYYQNGNITSTDPHFWLGTGTLCATAYIAKKHQQLLPVIMILLISLAPYLNWLQLSLSGNIVQNRYLSFPIFVLCICTYIYLLKIPGLNRGKILVKGVTASYLLILALTNISIMPLWKNSLQLWSWVVSENPESAIARTNLGQTLATLGEHEKAIEQLDKSLQLQDNFVAQSTLAKIHLEQGNDQEAINKTQKAMLAHYPFKRKMQFLTHFTRQALDSNKIFLVESLLSSMPAEIKATLEYRIFLQEISNSQRYPGINANSKARTLPGQLP